MMGMTTTLLFSLRMEYQSMDRNLMNSAQVLAQSPQVAEVLSGRSGKETLTAYLDSTISRVKDIDAIVVADRDGIIRYSPDPSYEGTVYPEYQSLSVLNGESTQVDTGAGVSELEHRALASVTDEEGELLGFVSVGIGVRSVHQTVIDTVACFAILTFLAAGVGLLFSRHLSGAIKDSLMGYEPDVFRKLFHQREDILEALDEGILAIDRDCVITYMNAACLGMFGAKDAGEVLGRPLLEIYPASQLPRLLTTGKPEYNVHLKQMPGSQEVLANRMPIWEDGEIVGAVAVFRDRTEVTNLAEALTGSRHLVDVSEVHHQSVSRVMNQIEDTAVAALLVGKASRAAELGIQLQVDPRSSLSGEEHMLPSGVMVTILGNLIENATESLNHSTRKQKEIHVSILENPDGLLLCVEDTGPGILPELLPYIFEPGVSTKGEAGHGLGLVQIKDLTDLYHGQIRVESEPKSGTSFFLSFPAHSTPSPQGGAPGSP